MSNAFVPIGSQFQVGDQHSAETFTALAEVNRISGFGWTRSLVDVTSLDSVGGYKEWLPTFRDGEVITVDCNYTASNWDKINNIFETEDEYTDLLEYRIVLKAGATVKYTWEFLGIIQSIKLGDIDSNGKQSLQFQVKITGAPLEDSGATG